MHSIIGIINLSARRTLLLSVVSWSMEMRYGIVILKSQANAFESVLLGAARKMFFYTELVTKPFEVLHI